MSRHASESDYADLALAVYVEELVRGRRVLYVGDPDSPAAERLAASAQRVDVASPRARVRGTRRGGRLRHRRWPGLGSEGDGPGGGREDDERWDLIVVPDLPGAGLASEDEVDRMGRWLGDDGVLVAGAPDPQASASGAGGLGYEDFFDLLEGTFESVRMVGQAPFAGWSLVDFAPSGGELEVTFDGSLLSGSGESAARYYALCAEQDVALDAYAVIQIPSAIAGPAIGGSSRREPQREARAEPPSRSGRGAELEGKVSELSERLREQQDALDAANVHAEEIEAELEQARDRLRSVDRERERASERTDEAERERERLRDEVAQLRSDLRAAEGEESFDEEYARLETALQERGRELTELRAEVERRGVLVRDLVEELREARAELPAGPAVPVPPAPGTGAPGAAPAGADGLTETIELSADQLQRTLSAQLAEAVERAVAAEADKTELSFRLDEVRGELAVARRRCAQELEALRRVEAGLHGTARGLRARLAETIELYQLTQARLTLVEDDRDSLRRRNEDLVRQLSEVREQLELEIAKERVRSDARLREAEREPDSSAPAVTAEQLARLRSVEAGAAQREGQLLGALTRCREEAGELAARMHGASREAQAAREALGELEQKVDGMRFGYEARVSELVAELDAVTAGAERALVQVGELRTKLEIRERAEAAARAERDEARSRLADSERAREAAREEAAGEGDTSRDDTSRGDTGRGDTGRGDAGRGDTGRGDKGRGDKGRGDRGRGDAGRGEPAPLPEVEAEPRSRVVVAGRRSSLEGEAEAPADPAAGGPLSEAEAAQIEPATLREARQEAEALRREVEALRAQAHLASAAQEPSEERTAAARASLQTRDAMIARLQGELAQASDRRRELEKQLDERDALAERLRRDLEEARAAGLGASEDGSDEEARRELDELTARLEASEAERRGAREALEEVREMLARLAEELRSEEEAFSSATSDGGASGGVEARRLRDRLAKLDAEARDRDVMLRSLTAQLQERDDRIRALERLREGNGGDSDDAGELQARLFEMEERVARLREELEHERSARRAES